MVESGRRTTPAEALQRTWPMLVRQSLSSAIMHCEGPLPSHLLHAGARTCVCTRTCTPRERAAAAPTHRDVGKAELLPRGRDRDRRDVEVAGARRPLPCAFLCVASRLRGEGDSGRVGIAWVHNTCSTSVFRIKWLGGVPRRAAHLCIEGESGRHRPRGVGVLCRHRRCLGPQAQRVRPPSFQGPLWHLHERDDVCGQCQYMADAVPGAASSADRPTAGGLDSSPAMNTQGGGPPPDRHGPNACALNISDGQMRPVRSAPAHPS